MSTCISQQPQHLQLDDALFLNDILQVAIAKSASKIEKEKLVTPQLKQYLESCTSIESRGSLTFELHSTSQKFENVLAWSNTQFKLETSLDHIYPGSSWAGNAEPGQNGDDLHSILIAKYQGTIVALVCLRFQSVSSEEAPQSRFLKICIGSFFLEPNFRGGGHSTMMSNSVGHLGTALLKALYLQQSKFGLMGVSVSYDFPNYEEHLHPFINQISRKLSGTLDMLEMGYLFPIDTKHHSFNFYPRSPRQV